MTRLMGRAYKNIITEAAGSMRDKKIKTPMVNIPPGSYMLLFVVFLINYIEFYLFDDALHLFHVSVTFLAIPGVLIITSSRSSTDTTK